MKVDDKELSRFLSGCLRVCLGLRLGLRLRPRGLSNFLGGELENVRFRVEGGAY